MVKLPKRIGIDFDYLFNPDRFALGFGLQLLRIDHPAIFVYIDLVFLYLEATVYKRKD